MRVLFECPFDTGLYGPVYVCRFGTNPYSSIVHRVLLFRFPSSPPLSPPDHCASAKHYPEVEVSRAFTLWPEKNTITIPNHPMYTVNGFLSWNFITGVLSIRRCSEKRTHLRTSKSKSNLFVRKLFQSVNVLKERKKLENPYVFPHAGALIPDNARTMQTRGRREKIADFKMAFSCFH